MKNILAGPVSRAHADYHAAFRLCRRNNPLTRFLIELRRDKFPACIYTLAIELKNKHPNRTA